MNNGVDFVMMNEGSEENNFGVGKVGGNLVCRLNGMDGVDEKVD